VAPNKRDNVTVPIGYDYDVVVKWGDRVLPGAPRFDAYNQTPKAQAQQFGYNCDYVAMLRTGKRGRAVLVVNNEYTNEELMFPSGRYSPNEIRRISIQAHGMSVVEIRRGRRSGSWEQVPVEQTTLNRRITGDSPMRMVGPAAGAWRLRTSSDPTGRHALGTLNNCAGGTTPWGTVLSGEENFNQYFDISGRTAARHAESYERYSLNGEETRGWGKVDPRFDLSQEPNEPFRFGWIVEVDPLRPGSTPRKHTMLGRLKHEGANIRVGPTGHVAAYMGDDEKGEYMYKFVSRRRWRDSDSPAARRHNMRLLQEGTLYVARFTGDGTDDGVYDGTGRWIPLASDRESFVDGMTVQDVLIDTRLAGDAVGATAMDRPEDVDVHPQTGKVYAALTNNDERGVEFPVNEPNPIGSSMIRDELGEPLYRVKGNRHGYVLELTEAGNDPRATRFGWVLMLVCGDPETPRTYFAGYPKDKVSPISCPDNLAFDPAGNLWVATDGNALGSNDGMFAVPLTGRHRGRVRQFLTVPVGAETCGPLISRDGRTVFAAVQHPGEVDGVTFEDPASTWPHTDRFPRPGVICSYRVDGGRIGI
jgi:secreted PhoX family phosphatase